MKLFTAALAAVFAFAPMIVLSADDAVARGRQLFEEKKCKMCHQIGTVGNPKGVLDYVGNKHDADTLRMWLTNPKEMAKKAGSTRKPPMPPVKTLSEEDLDALVAYLSTLKQS